MIWVAWVYEASPEGRRFLVDRVWPRGIRRDQLAAVWLHDVAPSEELRRWFGHDPARWEEFQARYAAELDACPQAWAPVAEAARGGDVVLLYAARDTAHNNAVALAAYVDRRLSTTVAGPAVDEDVDEDPGGPAATCAVCGRVAATADGTPPATWTATRAGERASGSSAPGPIRWLCERCTREHVGALEARLEPAWW
jgi:uncharacterized protein YeaO (DUF488 family)